MIIIPQPIIIRPEPPRKEIVRNGIKYREVRPCDDDGEPLPFWLRIALVLYVAATAIGTAVFMCMEFPSQGTFHVVPAFFGAIAGGCAAILLLLIALFTIAFLAGWE